MQRLKEEVKKRILEAGKERFKNDGFEEASMRQIASDAGISTGNIYRYFLTKTHLLEEILNDLENDLKIFLDEIPEKYEEIKSNVFFKNIIDKILELYEKRETEVKILFKCRGQKQFIVFKERLLNMFCKKIENINQSIDKGFTDKVLGATISRAIFEGLAYCVFSNQDDMNLLRNRMYLYAEIMITDLDKRVLDAVKRGI